MFLFFTNSLALYPFVFLDTVTAPNGGDSTMDEIVPSIQLADGEWSSEIFNDLLTNNRGENVLTWL